MGKRISNAGGILTENNQFSIGYTAGAVAAILTIVVSTVFLWDRFFLVERNQSDGSAISQMATPSRLSKLEAQLASQLKSSLRSSGCFEVELILLEALGKLTPDEQTNSGFTGYFLEGKAELDSGDNVMQVRIAGTGKGPFAQSSAVAMATESFMLEILNDSNFSTLCNNQ